MRTNFYKCTVNINFLSILFKIAYLHVGLGIPLKVKLGYRREILVQWLEIVRLCDSIGRG